MKKILPFCFRVYIQSSIILSITNSRASSSADYECNDHVGNEDACFWIARNNQTRTNYCSKKSHHLACPVVCGSCCEDDADFTFSIHTGNVVTCNWLTKHRNIKVNAERQAEYCRSKKKKYRLVKWACVKSCESCPDQIPYNMSPVATSPPVNTHEATIEANEVYVAPSPQPSEIFTGTTIPSIQTYEHVNASAEDTASTIELAVQTTPPTKTPKINMATENTIQLPSISPSLKYVQTSNSSPSPPRPTRFPRRKPKSPTQAPKVSVESGAAMAMVYDKGGSGKLGGKKGQSAYPSTSPSNLPTMEGSRVSPSQQPSSNPSIIPSMSPSVPTPSSDQTSFSPTKLRSVSIEPAPEVLSSKTVGTWRKALTVSGIAVGSTIVFILLLLVCLIASSRQQKRSFPGI